MKKIFLLLFAITLLSVGVNAQAFNTISTNTVFNYQFGAADTVIKNGTKTMYVYANPFCETARLQTTLVRSRGTYTKARVILSTSLDAVNWTPIDTLAFAGTGATISLVSDLKTNVYNQYLKVDIKPYDTTQTLKGKHFLLIKKPQ